MGWKKKKRKRKRHSSGPSLTIQLKLNCSLVTPYQLRARALSGLIRGFFRERASFFFFPSDRPLAKGESGIAHRQCTEIRSACCFDYCATCCEVIGGGGVMMSGVCACRFLSDFFSPVFFFFLPSRTHIFFHDGSLMPAERIRGSAVLIRH